MAQKANQGYTAVLVGATGAVGKEFLKILEERRFPLCELRPTASEKSSHYQVDFCGEQIPVQNLSPQAFEGADLAFFSAGSSVSRDFVPVANEKGCIVIDNTSAFRMDSEAPLVVPEVNGELLKIRPPKGVISIPNCSTIQMVVALAPIHQKVGIRRILVATYQSTSGAGKKAMEELSQQVTDLYSYREINNGVFPHRIAFNLIPGIGDFDEDGVSLEEKKICEETQKIFNDPTIGVSATAVRVPTFHCHGEAINVETKKPLSPDEARTLLSKAEGITIVDNPRDHEYPLVTEAQGQDHVFVGRIRKDPSQKNSLNLWVVADNLRKGAALNGVQIAELLIANHVL